MKYIPTRIFGEPTLNRELIILKNGMENSLPTNFSGMKRISPNFRVLSHLHILNMFLTLLLLQII